jgi:hypothetical protein
MRYSRSVSGQGLVVVVVAVVVETIVLTIDRIRCSKEAATSAGLVSTDRLDWRHTHLDLHLDHLDSSSQS